MSKFHKSIVNKNPKLTHILFAIYTGTHKGFKSVITFFRVDSFFKNVRLDETMSTKQTKDFKEYFFNYEIKYCLTWWKALYPYCWSSKRPWLGWALAKTFYYYHKTKWLKTLAEPLNKILIKDELITFLCFLQKVSTTRLLNLGNVSVICIGSCLKVCKQRFLS